MYTIKQLLKPGGYIVFEVPDCSLQLRTCDYTMLWEEHMIYFVPDTLKNSFNYTPFKLSLYKKYLVQKGSITINGVSLTIAKILKDGFQIVIIPQTLKLTNLMYLKEKDVVNIEFDVLGKYIKKFLK